MIESGFSVFRNFGLQKKTVLISIQPVSAQLENNITLTAAIRIAVDLSPFHSFGGDDMWKYLTARIVRKYFSFVNPLCAQVLLLSTPIH